MSAFDDFQWRGLVYDASEGTEERLAAGPTTVYVGFDPTASSLHVGSLLPILTLARLQRHGHRPIAVVGGGTGLIGDPSGKAQERQLLTREIVAENCAGIRAQLERFLDFGAAPNAAKLIDNADWLCEERLVDFLRDIGKHFTVNYMLAKESVGRRLEHEEGISFTEFSYLLLQSYDFLVLYDREGCEMQAGGSDQWGNITAGAELIRRLRGKKAFGLVHPLVTTAAGTKFGKTEAGAVWLDAARTSPYRFYQFWLNTTDDDVVKYLQYFTFLSREAVGELATATATAPQERAAQRVLAREVTTMVHGAEACARAECGAAVLCGGDVAELSPDEILEVMGEVPSSRVDPAEVAGDGVAVVELLARSGLVESKGAARRLVREGGAYVNDARVGDEARRVRREDFLGGRVLVLRKGQKRYHVVTLAAAEEADRERRGDAA